MATTTTALRPVPHPSDQATWEQATDAFLRRDLAPGTRRIYRLTLSAVGSHLGEAVGLAGLSSRRLNDALHAAYPTASPNSWNRHVATVRSFTTFCERHGWLNSARDLTKAIERRKAPADHSKPECTV